MGAVEAMIPTETTETETQAPVIMMVDDDPQLRVMLGYALRQEQFRVIEASSGKEAL